MGIFFLHDLIKSNLGTKPRHKSFKMLQERCQSFLTFHTQFVRELEKNLFKLRIAVK